MKIDDVNNQNDFINKLENLDVPEIQLSGHKRKLKQKLLKELYYRKTSPTINPLRRILDMVKFYQRKILVPALIFILIFTGIGYYLFKGDYSVKPTFAATYRLTNEKISQSAPIILNIPENFNKETSYRNITFSPEIKGEFLPSSEENKAIFKPAEKLKLNSYYLAELTTPEGVIKSDFLVVEDPEIVAIFPHEKSEAPETSEITIVFNRPMVPLTTLGYLDKKDVPVEITPSTEGRFKWITTSNLQFISKERLFRSSRYKVAVKSGMVSMDGLEVKGKEIEFITRKLRYLGITEGSIIYNQPISFYFNQPVDLEKTKKEITLVHQGTVKQIPFIAEYGKKVVEEPGKPAGTPPKKEIDKSTILIYNQKDKFGRSKFWDFDNSYSLNINRAYPEEGDIVLEEKRFSTIKVGDPIESITAESTRTQYTSADFFDPQGKLWVNFYEEIDLDKSIITSSKLKEIGHGEKLKDETQDPAYGMEGEKTTDKKKIYLVFDSEKVGLGEKLEVNFEKIANSAGLVINREPIKRIVTAYPKFKILKTSPAHNSTKTELTQMAISSTTPIMVPEPGEYEKFLKADLSYELRAWNKSWRSYVPEPYTFYGLTINPGEFGTWISWGLMPVSNYTIELNFTDAFGQTDTLTLKFTTGEMPSQELRFHHLQNPYSITNSENTTLNYATINFEYLNMEIYKFEPLTFFNYLQKALSYYEKPTSFTNYKEKITASINLPKKYWLRNFFQINLKTYFKDPIGHYILSFSHPNYIPTYYESPQTYLTVTNLGVVEKRILPEVATGPELKIPPGPLTPEQMKTLSNLYWVTSLTTLEPVSGAKVELYQEKEGKFILVSTHNTDERGIAPTPSVPQLAGVIISKTTDSTIIPSNASRLNWPGSAYSTPRIYLYTDKPIYQGGQEVFLKGIYFTGYDGNYELPRTRKVSLKISNPRGDEIFNQELDVNDYGTFNTSIILEKNSPLGWYWVSADDIGYTSFDIQEYVPAPFEVNVKAEKEEYISKDIANLEINARYYFGVPLEGGEVTYTVGSQNYYFDRYQNGYYNFGSDFYWPYYDYSDRFILRGKTALDANGKAKISQLLDLDKFFKEQKDRKSKIIVFDITVQNSQGQSVSTQKSFVLHAGEFYLGINSDKYFAGKDEKFNLKVKSVDTQGKALKIDNITLNLYKIDWVYSKRQGVGGGFQYQWERKRNLTNTFSFSTDSKGDYKQEIQLSQEGEYEAEVSATDRRGNLVFSTYSIYIYGKGEVGVKPTIDTQLEIEVEKKQLNVGDEGKILIKSPYTKARALISIERGKIFEYHIKEVEGNLLPFSFTIKEEYIPGVYVSVLLISSKPEVKFGMVEFQINTELKKLNIEVKSNKDKYLPGEEVSLNILTNNHAGKPVPAELSISVVDLSVLALKGNPKKDPLIYFYSGFPLNVSTASNLKDILIKVEFKTKGGGALRDESELPRKKRGVFKETAYWQAVVRTNDKGEGQVKFSLPDNLTTWQVETLGLTRDTKLGVYYLEFITRKDLMVVPLKPRFAIPGDIFQIGAQVFNQSKDVQNLSINFESPTLTLLDDKSEKKLLLQPDKSETIYFKVQAPSNIEKGEHIFTLSAKGSGLEDVVEQTISITPNDTYEVTVTSNYTTLPVFKEYVYLTDEVLKDRGNLTVKTSATLAVFLSDALKSLFDFPYGCSEQIASKLSAIAIVKRGLNIPNIAEKFNLEKIKYGNREYTIDEAVEIGLTELYNTQNWDGGFPFWRNGESNFYLTLHIVETFLNLKKAGFQVNQTSWARAIEYLYQKITTDYYIYQNKDIIILSSYTLFKVPYFKYKEALKLKIINLLKDELYINEQINSTSLALLSIILQSEEFDVNLKNKVFKLLDNRIKIDGRGAFMEVGKNLMWQYFETPIKNTALYLKAQVAMKTDKPTIEKVIRWLINSRYRDGGWGSTNNTLTVIDAFTDFLEWKRETESEFSLDITLNEKILGNISFNPTNILNQFSKEVPIQELEFKQTNLVTFQKTNLNNLPNAFYYDMALKYYLPADQIPPRDEGFSITREFYNLNDKRNENPLTKAKVGEVLRVRLQITLPKSRNFVMIEDYIPAGMEIVNLDLATEQKSLLLEDGYKRDKDYWRRYFDRSLYPQYKAIHNDRVFLYLDYLSPGVYEFEYFARALIKGKFTQLPAKASEMYFPENFGRTQGRFFEIE